ncbi:MAG: FHA domain-containing protein [Oscillospiraceae bacterium]|nr:FHA domain-containing protein [Oscillospiraceae bacterium]
MAEQYIVVVKRESGLGGAAQAIRIDVDGIRSPIQLKCGEEAHMALEAGVHKLTFSFWGNPSTAETNIEVYSNRTISCKGRAVASSSLFLDPIFIYDEAGTKINGITSLSPRGKADGLGPSLTPNNPYAAPAQPDSKPRIQGMGGCFDGKRFAFSDRIRLGRNPGNDIVYPVNAQGISGFHCEIILREGRIYLTDLGSTYGTFIPAGRLAANQPVELHYGDTFWLGSQYEKFQLVRKQ